MSDHVTSSATWMEDGERQLLVMPAGFTGRVKRKFKPGTGESFVVRVEREEDAKKHHQLKWYYGYLVKQISEHTGYPTPEVDAMLRALHMPPDVETLSLMSYEQMGDFNRLCEIYANEVVGIQIYGPEDARRWKGV